MEKIKEYGLIIGVVVVMLLSGLFIIEGAQNGAITREETINTTQSNITVEVKRKNKLFDELVAAANSYKNYEAETFKEVVEARKTETIESQEKAISVLVEAYPELKSNEHYTNMMMEFSITENRIADHQKTFNTSIENYNKYVRRFPNTLFLGIKGYEVKNYEYLQFEDVEEYDTSKI